MWKTPEQLGLSQKMIEEIVEELWSEEKTRKCPDCQASPGEIHSDGCDVPHCPTCGIQALQCDEHPADIVWDGLWPNTRMCYENKWIVYWDGPPFASWNFDYNKAAIEEQISLDKK